MRALLTFNCIKFFFFKSSQIGGSYDFKVGEWALVDPRTTMSGNLPRLQKFTQELPQEFPVAGPAAVLNLFSDRLLALGVAVQDQYFQLHNLASGELIELKDRHLLYGRCFPLSYSAASGKLYQELRVYSVLPILKEELLSEEVSQLDGSKMDQILVQLFPQTIAKWTLLGVDGVNWEGP